MHYLFEESDYLNTPIECFYFDSEKEIFPIKPHWHYFIEIIYMISGNAEMREGKNRYFLTSGNMIVFHPKAVHSIYSADGSPLRYAVMKFDINRLNMTSSYAPKLRSIYRAGEKSCMNIVFSPEQTAEMRAEQTFFTCIEEMNKQIYGFDLIIRSELYSLLIKILRHWQADGFHVDSEAFAEDSQYDIFNITEYIDENMGNGIQVTEIAKQCKMSYSYFAKKFLAVYGKTCKKYIEDMRIFKAEEFLIFTDFDLNYISQETGFSDCSHFIRSFKNSRGCTPKQFRMKHKG